MSTKPLILYFGLFILLFFSSCEKCVQENPNVTLTFIDEENNETWQPIFDSVYAKGVNTSFVTQSDIKSIPLDLNSTETTFYFRNDTLIDTLQITYDLELTKINGVCMEITNTEIKHSSFDIKCEKFSTGFTYNNCADYYEIIIYY